MGKGNNKHKKKSTYTSLHSSVIGLNFMYNNYKKFFPEMTDLYEKLHNIFLQKSANEKRDHYLSVDDLMMFIAQNSTNPLKNDYDTVSALCLGFAITLSWKQYKQVYKFDNVLLESLWDIDYKDEKNVLLQEWVLDYLPTKAFYVDMPIKLNDKRYDGFYFYIDKGNISAVERNVYIYFLKDPIVNHDILDYYTFNLAYDTREVNIVERDTGKVAIIKPEPFDYIKLLNITVFQQLGDEVAYELIIKLNQIIMYLGTQNADLSLKKKREKKPDIHRTRISASECEYWDVGKNFAELYKSKHLWEPYEKSEQSNSESDMTSPVILGRHRMNPHNRPHLRRAHWAYYWIGKKDGSEERKRVLRWIDGVYINNTGEDIEIPTREIIRQRFEDIE